MVDAGPESTYEEKMRVPLRGLHFLPMSTKTTLC